MSDRGEHASHGAADSLRAPLWSAADARRFSGADGIGWRVVECDCTHVPGARSAHCLVFLSEGVVRRLWDYPTDWRALALPALEALMLGR